MMNKEREFDCSLCGSMGCHRRDAPFPALNVIMGLCVGNDALFSRYSKAPD